MSGGGNLPIGPGIWGFIAFFVLALALWFLVRNMNNRLRRMAYRDRDRAEQFAANADVDGSTSDRTSPEAKAAGADTPSDEPGPDASPTDTPPRP